MQFKLINYFIAIVWLVNGLFCKVLNLVPRHEEIVARILGNDYARPLTLVIGLLEIAIGIWILCGITTRLNATIQIFLVATMNILEFVLAHDLLLWGRVNSIFALMFILLIYYNEFYLHRKLIQRA